MAVKPSNLWMRILCLFWAVILDLSIERQVIDKQMKETTEPMNFKLFHKNNIYFKVKKKEGTYGVQTC